MQQVNGGKAAASVPPKYAALPKVIRLFYAAGSRGQRVARLRGVAIKKLLSVRLWFF
jgi:hypothetical protein